MATNYNPFYQFEVPYNNRYDLADGIKLIDPTGKAVDCFYGVPYWSDYQSVNRSASFGINRTKQDRASYEKNVGHLADLFPGKPQLVMQQNFLVKDKDFVKYYHDLGFAQFCCGSFEQAELIRNMYPEANIRGSITMRVTKEHIEKHPEYKDVFNGFILHFSYSRDLEMIKAMPEGYEYVILANCSCNPVCPGAHHWFYDYTKNPFILDEPAFFNCRANAEVWTENSLIKPVDLPVFHPYIHSFKLQERTAPTDEILNEFCIYKNFMTYIRLMGLEPNADPYLREKNGVGEFNIHPYKE